jgi:hypothetical protein
MDAARDAGSSENEQGQVKKGEDGRLTSRCHCTAVSALQITNGSI